MKKIILLSMFISVIAVLRGQTLNTTNTNDWNKVWQSGFYQSFMNTALNSPPPIHLKDNGIGA